MTVGDPGVRSGGFARRRVGTALAAVLLLTGTGCGSRVTREEVMMAAGVRSAGVDPGQALGDQLTVAPADGGAAAPGDVPAEGSGVAAPAVSGAPSPTGQQGTGTTVARARPGTRPTGGAGAAGGPASTVPNGGNAVTQPGTGSDPGTATGPGGAGSGPAAAKAPVVIGNIGTYSGVLGGIFAGGNTVARVWAKALNVRGGLNGHPVKLIQADDGGDPARYLALAKDMVENQSAIAFVGNLVPLSVNGPKAYLEGKGVPVVGGDLVSPEWWESPMYFPQGSFVNDLIAGAAKLSVRAGGKKKMALLWCSEANACANFRDVIVNGGAERAGAELVYTAQVSLAQPDFTSECLQARNRGAEILMVASDGNSTSRVATSCAQQGYTPQYSTASVAVIDALKANPALDGLVAPMANFAWFSSDTPAAQEYQDALRTYAPDTPSSGAGASVWTSGKLLEQAVRTFSGIPTSKGIVDGLRSLKDETLEGLTVPLNFSASGPSRPSCYFGVQVKSKGWISPHGSGPICD